MNFIKSAALLAAIAIPAAASAFPFTVTKGAKNVVLVHGAYVDASSTWRQVHDRLWIDGYKVTVVQQTGESLDQDVAATRAAIEAQDGPVVLVGHDTGGAVISIAGTSAQKAVAPAALATPGWEAAWRAKPSHAIVAADDRVINPELQRWMYKRAGSKVVEIKSSHALNLAKPEEVAAVIVGAAQEVR